MRYACLIYDDEKKLGGMSKSDADTFMSEYFQFTEDIKQSGQYVAGEALHPINSSTSLRIRSGKLSTTDGPFAETTEQLGGFLMIDVPDLNDAIRVAAQFPAARFGSVEVRPLKEHGCA